MKKLKKTILNNDEFHLILMKIIILYFLIISNSYAISWNSSEFKNSMNKYKQNIKEILSEPEEFQKKIRGNYESQLLEIKEEIENIRIKNQDLAENNTFYVLRDLSNRSKDYLYARDGYSVAYYLQRDFLDSMYFLNDVTDNAPFISPLKREIYNKMDYLRFQGYFYESAIKSAIRKR